MAGIALYELAGAEDDRRFSPFCWRIHLALLHKGLAFETIPWRFTEKERIAVSGSEKVPVLEDGATVVPDSWAIAEYLDATYPDRPLLDSPMAKAEARFIGAWTERVLQGDLFRLIVTDIEAHLHEKDRAYFRSSREARLGTTLEVFCNRSLEPLRGDLGPLRHSLIAQPFLSGAAPAWADYMVFGAFQWARCVSPLQLLEPSDPVWQWRERMLDAFDGAGRAAKGYAA